MRLPAALFLIACAATARAQPNVVVVLLDDLDSLVTGPFLPEVMPRMTALRDEGVLFTHAFAPTPICCAARATILTGLLGHHTGVLTNGGEHGGWGAFVRGGNEERSIAALLKGRGYVSGAFGKYMNGYALAADGSAPAVPPGWNEWQVLVDPGLEGYRGYSYRLLSKTADTDTARVESYGVAPTDYSTDVIRDKALAFIGRSAHSGRPFFAYVAPTAPHFPLQPAPRHTVEAQQWTGRVPRDRGTYFSDGESFADKPSWLRNTLDVRRQRQARIWNAVDWGNRMGSLYAADELIGAIRDRLSALGVWDDTVLIVTSDNGYNLGAHALLHKMAPYEESIRVPMVVAAGRNVGLQRGRNLALRHGASEDAWVTHADLAPTILDLSGDPAAQESMDGRSLLPLLRGEGGRGWDHRDILLQYEGDHAGEGVAVELPENFAPALLLDVPTYRAIRAHVDDHDYLYVEWSATDERELYDLTADPRQVSNLLHPDPQAHGDLISTLRSRLLHLQQNGAPHAPASHRTRQPPRFAEGGARR